MSMATMQEVEQLLDQLNAYDATHSDPRSSNVWQDVILTHPMYSESATDAVDRGDSSRFALVDGTVVEWDAPSRRWQSGPLQDLSGRESGQGCGRQANPS